MPRLTWRGTSFRFLFSLWLAYVAVRDQALKVAEEVLGDSSAQDYGGAVPLAPRPTFVN